MVRMCMYRGETKQNATLQAIACLHKILNCNFERRKAGNCENTLHGFQKLIKPGSFNALETHSLLWLLCLCKKIFEENNQIHEEYNQNNEQTMEKH